MKKKVEKPEGLHIRNTRIREEILTLFIGNKGVAFSEAEINQVFSRKADRVTIYHNIRMLLEKLVIHRVICEDGKLKYAMATDTTRQHPHFECIACGKVSCLNDKGITNIELPAGFQSQATHMLVRGLCANCVQTQI
ncbi:MAG: Fur family transcriptional regulator [Flammeovirgaceae bacterium]